MSKHKIKGNDPIYYRVADDSGIPVPSRIQILQFMMDRNQPVNLKDLCGYFSIDTKVAEKALLSRLGRLARSGYILQDRKRRFGLPEKMDMVIGRVQGHANGFGFVIPDNGEPDLYLHHKQMRKVLHGDQVLAKPCGTDHRGRREGAIVEVLIQENREIIGRFLKESGVAFVEPDDPRYSRDISIPKSKSKDAKNGEIVVVRIIEHPVKNQHAVAEVIEVVGKELAPGMEVEIALRKHEIPYEWPHKIRQYMDSIKHDLDDVSLDSNRKDIRDLTLVTIDGIDARDFDDAVYCQPTKSGWKLIVAIADVSHYVRTNTVLDDEALNRGNSVYFPNRVVPMLPEELSNGLCSLNPEEDRYCMVCEMQINKQGKVKKFAFYEGLMYSHARLTYEIVNKICVKKDKSLRSAWKPVVQQLDDLYQLSLAFRKTRQQRGTVDFEIPDAFIEFDTNKKISQITARQRNDAHKLIEECMLAANVCAAEFLQKNWQGRAIFRNHEGPDSDGLVELRKFLSGMRLKLNGGDSPHAKDYAHLVAQVANRSDISGVVQSVLLRSLSQAVYSPDNLGHFALAYPIYTHFTSPIRRYPDLVVHRMIKHIINANNPSALAGQGMSPPQVAEHCSFTERRAEDATWDVIGWLKAEFMQDRIGNEFSGVITGVKEFGLFVQLDDIFVDGLVHVTSLGNDYYHFDVASYSLYGERSGKRYRLGDHVMVSVVRVDLDAGKIDFELIDNETSKKSNKGNKLKALKAQKKSKFKEKSKFKGKDNDKCKKKGRIQAKKPKALKSGKAQSPGKRKP